MNHQNTEVMSQEIELGQGTLFTFLKKLMGQDATVQAWEAPLYLDTPFAPFVHNWEILKKAQSEKTGDTPEEKEARAALKKILDFVQGSKDLKSYFKNRETSLKSKGIAYEHLWTLFPVGTEVIAKTFLDKQQILVVDETPYANEGDKTTDLWCWYHDHDGRSWVPMWLCFEVERYRDLKPIHTLPCYPLEYHKPKEVVIDLQAFRKSLIERGKRFEGYCKSKVGAERMFDYNGQYLCVERPLRSQYADRHIVSQAKSIP